VVRAGNRSVRIVWVTPRFAKACFERGKVEFNVSLLFLTSYLNYASGVAIVSA
jgi:hypothetical protein